MHCHNRRLWRPIANSVPAAPLQACKPLLLRQRRLPGPSWLPTSPPDHSLNFKIGARTPGSPDIGETQPAEDDLAEDGLEGFRCFVCSTHQKHALAWPESYTDAC